MKMEESECSETSTYKIRTSGNYPEENIQHNCELLAASLNKLQIINSIHIQITFTAEQYYSTIPMTSQVNTTRLDYLKFNPTNELIFTALYGPNLLSRCCMLQT